MVEAASLLTSLLIFVCLVALILSIWMLILYKDIDVKVHNDSYNNMMYVLIAQIAFSFMMLVMTIISIVRSFRNKTEYEKKIAELKRNHKSTYDKWFFPFLMLIMFGSVMTVTGNVMLYIFKDLIVTQATRDSYSYNTFTNSVFISPTIYLLFTLSIFIIYMYVEMNKKCSVKGGGDRDGRSVAFKPARYEINNRIGNDDL
jgi:ABC-type Fe3+ transport system permease subunit